MGTASFSPFFPNGLIKAWSSAILYVRYLKPGGLKYENEKLDALCNTADPKPFLGCVCSVRDSSEVIRKYDG